MRLIIIVNETNEDEAALVNFDTKEAIIKGDSYHDKIFNKIEGFLQGLDFAKYKYELLEEDFVEEGFVCEFYQGGHYILPDNPLFDLLGFNEG